MQIDSLKKRIIESFYILPLVERFKNENVIVVTSAGIISGKPQVSAPMSDKPEFQNLSHSEFFETTANEICKKYYEDFGTDTETSCNDGYIILKDVTIITGNTKSNFPMLMVFFDEIVGITYGNLG